MPLTITITDVGRAEIINAENTGTDPVLITEIGVGTGEYAPNPAQTALVAETKRINTISGEVVADDTIHVVAQDEGNGVYSVSEFGLYSDSGTLIAVYSQVGDIMQKTAQSGLLLAVDIVLATINAASLTFGDTSFTNPPGTTLVPGVLQLADQPTMDAEVSATRVPPVNVIATYVAAKLAALVDSSPATLNTLNELAAALGDDPNFATTITNALALKVNSSDVNLTGVDSSTPPNSSALPVGVSRFYADTGGPPTASWGQTLTVKQGTTRAFQIWSHHTAAGEIYYRNCLNDGTGWQAWQRILVDAPSDGSQYSRKDGAWSVVSTLPVGAVVIAPSSAPFSGTLELNGATLSRATYAALWAYAQASGNLVTQATKQAGNFGDGDGSTTFSLPDMRGEFPRGWDHGRGVDSGRGIGTWQDFALEQMTGSVEGMMTPLDSFAAGQATGVLSVSSITKIGSTIDAATPSGLDNKFSLNFDASLVANTAAETRPRNVAMMFCIKY